MQFSVLLSIYYKEDPLLFHRAMVSIYEEQTLKPDEIVLVQDGPLPKDLSDAIVYWQKALPEVFKTIPLSENQGLGIALAIGLEACSHSIVARMDTDDIALPNRFERQIAYFNDKEVMSRVPYPIDICGSWVDEFETDELCNTSTRRLPEFHSELIKFAKRRNPINHPSVMFKKDLILKAGNYQKMPYFEDWYLWVRAILCDAHLYNIQESLVKMKAGYEQLERRRGKNYAKNEFNFLKALKRLNFLNFYQYVFFLFRVTVRILPKKIVHFIYKLLRGKK